MTDVSDPSLWLKNQDIVIGDAARRLLKDMTPDDQIQALASVKKFFMESAVRLKQYLHFCRQQNYSLLFSALSNRTVQQKVRVKNHF